MFINWGTTSFEGREHIRNEVLPVLLLLETAEGHLSARDVLLGVLEVGELQNHCRQ